MPRDSRAVRQDRHTLAAAEARRWGAYKARKRRLRRIAGIAGVLILTTASAAPLAFPHPQEEPHGPQHRSYPR